MSAPHSSGIVPNRVDHYFVLVEGRCIAAGDEAAMIAVARLFGVNKVGCMSPTGRTDGHGVYVRMQNRALVCAFCNEPIR